MTKKEIVDLIHKNLEILKEEEVYDLIYHHHGDYLYFMDQLGVSKYPRYDQIQDKYESLEDEKCSCEILGHHYDTESDDLFGLNKYPYEDECILCHKKHYHPRGHTIRFNPEKISDFDDVDKKPYCSIKYALYRGILKFLEPYNDNDEVDLYEHFNEIKKLSGSSFLYYKDIRNKDDYKVLLLTGSNEVKIDGHILKPRVLNKTSEFIKELKEVPDIQIDVLGNYSDSNEFDGRSIKKYDYHNLKDFLAILSELQGNSYDLVIDASNLVSYYTGEVKRFDIKDKVSADKFVTFIDSYGLSNEEKADILSEQRDNEKIYLHDFDYDCSRNLTYYEPHRYYYLDGDDIQYVGSDVLSRELVPMMVSKEKEDVKELKK